ncbi:hypothetical protein SSS_05862 [Sarcoptes scabiei]|uniref:Trafficking protein particle complex subunit n=1 Tax=Sarcoptes scabiei TaxID=52283 RepID=A0A132A743_SARSC|nr:hypothetical protein SSS_05862 [Sarcoptes scabiei]KPM06747.1 trafficking protein particle complex subunit 3-like protein [Sarcoptes scabiei]UXI18967.1 hypothetical protein NH340_JMT04910 [Sarcoptes scabiei]
MSKQANKNSIETKKINSDLFVLTYGAIVAQLVKECDNAEEINKQLDKMGYNIGLRLIEDYLSKTQMTRCHDFKDVAERIQNAFRIYLGFAPTITNWSAAQDEFSILIDYNPLTEFVELPDHLSNLRYCNLLCGVIRGALEMVQIDVQVYFLQDYLRGDQTTELRVRFMKKIEDVLPRNDD